MKKYLFLFFLLIAYLIIINNNDTKKVMLPKNISNENIIDVKLTFKNGINSKDLIELFNKYNYEYYINNITFKDNDINSKCNSIEKCINEIIDNSNNDNYVVNGFKINEINLISYKDEILSFVLNNNIDYSI